MLEEHERIKGQPRDCNLETVVAGLMIWSDSTHLASFGNAALWPIYLFLGNQSKYIRAKPNAFAAHHLAYIPKLPDTIQDYYKKTFGTSATAAVLTHCKRELMQAIWKFLLDDDFISAYEHGMVIEFPDGVSRQVFPRLLTYSADYPEKTLLATLKFLGRSPCPRCLVQKNTIFNLGAKKDRYIRKKTQRVDDEHRRFSIENARKAIFEFGRSMLSTAVENILGMLSVTPTRNAFSEKLSKFGLNFFRLFVPDFMHEFELGVWKAILTHLIRIIYEVGDNCIQEFNKRFRLMPTFGRGTIRRFSNNVSDLTKLAARDFEDILQCIIPVIEGLLPEPFNGMILDLLFELATWHAFGKLRMHTETTLFHFDNSTTRLGNDIRKFANECCPAFRTYDLPRETAARARRQGSKTARVPTTSAVIPKPAPVGRKQRSFNLATYKLHALGDYVHTIRLFGTTDNYSTQVGELEHRRVKRFYSRTNKIAFARGIAQHQHRERLLHIMKERKTRSEDETEEPLPKCLPEAHYQIGQSRKDYCNITAFLATHKSDLALKDFLPRLKAHILGRLLGTEPGIGEEQEFTQAQHNTLIIIKNRLYRHKILRVNYTSYDLRRDQDSLNPRTHADVMVLSHETEENPHPYWYARIIGIFHLDVRFNGPELDDHSTKRMDVLWVRWFARDRNFKSGWAARRLPRIGFYPQDDLANAFGFIDPNDIVRAVHLIPAYHFGRTKDLLPPSIARRKPDNNEDWEWYYVNMFVDRDMFMRFRGGAVGHKTTREATRCLLDDRDKLDRRPFTLERELGIIEDTADELMDENEVHSFEDGTDQDSGDETRSESIDSTSSDLAIPDTLADEMEEYGYGNLEEVIDIGGSDSDNEIQDVDDDEIEDAGH
ncbi:hypothetical protein PISMIDRAFT_274760 [Pisolithus microcarpus 441]|uniref:Uncharacterized protein n=1 Tax=Pisolithus microcarpus 441 TaxID=765257 RepID=A0A0C9ZW11_9AGAM|nr:hypothetical protein PISMIDRAFT_274760 [Pisolithus microcarpus 441]